MLPEGRVVADERLLEGVGFSMRRSILLTVLALGAQAAWAQDATDPTGDGVVVEDISETVDQAADDGNGNEVVDQVDVVEDKVEDGNAVIDDESEVAENETGVLDDGDEFVEDGSEVDEADVIEDEIDIADDDIEMSDDETEVSDDAGAVRTDNRSSRGAFRGGHHGQVSTLARAGLGPVFGKLRSQGYGDIAIEQLGNQITISAARAGETRQLVYDASTGALLSDVSGPSTDGVLRAFSSKLNKQSTVSSTRGAKSSNGSKDHNTGKGNGSGTSSGTGGGNGNSSGKGGDNGNSGGKGNGNGNGGDNGGGNGNGKNR